MLTFSFAGEMREEAEGESVERGLNFAKGNVSETERQTRRLQMQRYRVSC